MKIKKIIGVAFTVIACTVAFSAESFSTWLYYSASGWSHLNGGLSYRDGTAVHDRKEGNMVIIRCKNSDQRCWTINGNTLAVGLIVPNQPFQNEYQVLGDGVTGPFSN